MFLLFSFIIFLFLFFQLFIYFYAIVLIFTVFTFRHVMLVFKNTNNLLNDLNLIFSKSQNVHMHFSHCIYLMLWCLNSLGAFKRADFCFSVLFLVFYTINCAQNNNINKQCAKCILCTKLKKKNILSLLCLLRAIPDRSHILWLSPCTSSTLRLKMFGPHPATIFLPGCEPKTSIPSRWGPMEHDMARELRPPWGTYIESGFMCWACARLIDACELQTASTRTRDSGRFTPELLPLWRQRFDCLVGVNACFVKSGARGTNLSLSEN